MPRGEESVWGEITTRRGRVVYDRKKHPFDPKAIDRILLNYSEDISEREVQDQASHVRAIWRLSTNLYSFVVDEFTPLMSRAEYIALKRQIREALDFVAYVIVHGVNLLGVPTPVSHGLLLPLAMLINRYIEQLFTGSTVWEPNIGPYPEPPEDLEPEPPPESDEEEEEEASKADKRGKIQPGLGGRRGNQK